MPLDWSPLVDFLRRHERPLLMTHIRPDADGMGAQLALHDALKIAAKKHDLVAIRLYDPRETQLSKYWSAAAIPMRHFDELLSNKCDQKSEYWIHPDKYNMEEIAKLGIGLNDVMKAYRLLLRPNFAISGKK